MRRQASGLAALVVMVVASGCRDRLEFEDAGLDAPVEDAPLDVPDDSAHDGGGDVTPDAPDGGPTDAGPPCMGPPGLYVPGSCSVLAPRVRSFAPEFALWSDDAEKERFVLLPEGGAIDTSDPDAWIYPVGTVFFKTFSRDGLRIETRINTKVSEGTGISHWTMRTFAWNAAQNGVTEVTDGVTNALGTEHDIPPTSLCASCHTGAAVDVGLGFSAIQLNHPETEVSLADLLAESRLTDPIAVDDARVPGTGDVREALGYLHANCGGCHGGPAPQPIPDPMDLWIDVGHSDPRLTPSYLTTVGVVSGWPGAPYRVSPGLPDDSALLRRMQSRVVGVQMPPIATEIPHAIAIGTIRRWIIALD